MSSIEKQDENFSETEVREDEKPRLVPVSESIRYHKRAQVAEQQLEQLAEELAESKGRASAMEGQLKNLSIEQELSRKLAASGATDIEAAVLIAKSRLEAQGDGDLDGVIDELKREKQYLFSGSGSTGVGTRKTAGARERVSSGQTVLEKAAQRAAVTGNRTDLHEYLKLRRNFV
jgi:hypothetical protein